MKVAGDECIISLPLASAYILIIYLAKACFALFLSVC
jgi:hypothetical protein